jgi:hypothetical protein
MIRVVLLTLAGVVALAAPASAHKASDSYLQLTVTADRVDGQWDIALRDLEQAVGLDGDGDGAITWGELKARSKPSRLTRYRGSRSGRTGLPARPSRRSTWSTATRTGLTRSSASPPSARRRRWS